jgi:hypothetical protein
MTTTLPHLLRAVGLSTLDRDADRRFPKQQRKNAVESHEVDPRSRHKGCKFRVAQLGNQIDGDSLDDFQSPRCATVNGFSVHANVSVPAQDRMSLERLCRYAARRQSQRNACPNYLMDVCCTD